MLNIYIQQSTNSIAGVEYDDTNPLHDMRQTSRPSMGTV
jgi:hypothetical protein